jgi:hypothetical protein
MGEVHKQRFITANDNARHAITTFAQWFAFFWTLNAVVLAWLYGGTTHPPQAGQLLLTVVFVLLNGLALGVCWYFWIACNKLIGDAQIAQVEWSRISASGTTDTLPATTSLFPASFLSFSFFASLASFMTNILAWSLLPMLVPA